MPPDPSAIDEYIQQNKARYTREAIRDQLVAAGHDPAQVDEAWERLGASSPVTRPSGWRPGWLEFFLLLVAGAIGAAVIWAGEPYGAGGIAPIVYAILLSIGFGAAKLISITIDRGNIGGATVVFALLALATMLLAALNAFAPVFLITAAALLVVAWLLFSLRARNPRAAGMVGAALPILVWLIITGTCYAPLFSRA